MAKARAKPVTTDWHGLTRMEREERRTGLRPANPGCVRKSFAMDRRRFLKIAGAGVGSIVLGESLLAQSKSGVKEVAFTFDDPQVVDYPGYLAADVDARLRAALRDVGVKA